VWFGGENQELDPVVWRVEWPADITNAVVSEANPTETITNSDLEMARVVLQQFTLESIIGSESMEKA
jgi:hypothetical protein